MTINVNKSTQNTCSSPPHTRNNHIGFVFILGARANLQTYMLHDKQISKMPAEVGLPKNTNSLRTVKLNAMLAK